MIVFVEKKKQFRSAIEDFDGGVVLLIVSKFF